MCCTTCACGARPSFPSNALNQFDQHHLSTANRSFRGHSTVSCAKPAARVGEFSSTAFCTRHSRRPRHALQTSPARALVTAPSAGTNTAIMKALLNTCARCASPQYGHSPERRSHHSAGCVVSCSSPSAACAAVSSAKTYQQVYARLAVSAAKSPRGRYLRGLQLSTGKLPQSGLSAKSIPLLSNRSRCYPYAPAAANAA
jgi:hypothetical protein